MRSSIIAAAICIALAPSLVSPPSAQPLWRDSRLVSACVKTQLSKYNHPEFVKNQICSCTVKWTKKVFPEKQARIVFGTMMDPANYDVKGAVTSLTREERLEVVANTKKLWAEALPRCSIYTYQPV